MTVAAAVVLAAIAGVLHWKNKAPRVVAWLIMLAGFGLSATVLAYVGGIGSYTVLGVGAFFLTTVVTGLIFWFEAVKKHGLHRIRTPIVAAIFGITFASFGGGVLGTLSNAVSNGGGAAVDKGVTAIVGDPNQNHPGHKHGHGK